MLRCSHISASMEEQFAASDYITGDKFTIARCGMCGLSLTQPIPLKDMLGKYYPDAYYGDPTERRFPGIVQLLQQGLYAYRVRRVSGFVRGPFRRVLDIGCGKGFLLKEFQRNGWDVQGVELSDHSARHAREVLGLNIHVGDQWAKAMNDECIDAAILWHVLEHSPDPSQQLMEIHRLLVPGGLLLVSVPNFGSLEARLSTSGWFHLDVPRHLAHFTMDTLSTTLQECGYEIVSGMRLAPEYDLFSFVQSTLNRAGLPPNHLYRMLRGRGAKLPGLPPQWWYQPLTLALAIPLTLIGLVWVPLLAIWGEGSTLSFFARKPMHDHSASKA